MMVPGVVLSTQSISLHSTKALWVLAPPLLPLNDEPAIIHLKEFLEDYILKKCNH